MKQVTKWLLALFCMSIFAANSNATDALASSRQCLVVTTESWSAPKGTMSIFERESGGAWRQRGTPVAVVVGKTGLAWGRGLLETKSFAGPTKKEGDNKAPAGIFNLSRVFGYAPSAQSKMPYLALSANMVGVDDPQSRFYNQLVDQSKIDKDWRTAEEMFRKDGLYKWGVVVEHNSPPLPGAGSCIFLHIWRGPDKSTVGCTAMSEHNLVDLIRWLDPALHPVLIQLPRSIYFEQRESWNLPQFD
jgi:D-alanyl-D-alanine dipeptidase